MKDSLRRVYIDGRIKKLKKCRKTAYFIYNLLNKNNCRDKIKLSNYYIEG